MKIEDLAFLREDAARIDGQRPERLEEVRDRIRTARRRRATAAMGGAAAAVLSVIVLVVAVAPQGRNATVRPSGRPSNDYGGVQVLGSAPFLSNRQASLGQPGKPGTPNVWVPRVRVFHTGPAPLNPLNYCVRDPRTWGALTTKVASYTDPQPAARWQFRNPRLNEYLLQYASGADAHQAFLDEFRHVTSCWGKGELGLLGASANDASHQKKPFDEAFAGQRGDGATLQHSVIRVARAGNVLIVIQDATMDDRSGVLLSQAVHQALPQYK